MWMKQIVVGRIANPPTGRSQFTVHDDGNGDCNRGRTGDYRALAPAPASGRRGSAPSGESVPPRAFVPESPGYSAAAPDPATRRGRRSPPGHLPRSEA